MTTLPPELVELIICEAWHSVMPSSTRTSFMTTCPLVNRTWKTIYAPIASQDLHITNLAYIYYLCDIAGRQKSIIYYDFIPQRTRTITCFVYLGKEIDDAAVKRVYGYLAKLPNDIGLNSLFPQVPYISFELGWIGIGRNPLSPQLCDIPICVRVYFHRYLSVTESARHKGETRVDVGISMTDSDPLRRPHPSTWVETLEQLRKVNLIGGWPWFLNKRYFPDRHRWITLDGFRHLCQSTYIYQHRGEIRDINWDLWMASKEPHSTWAKRLPSASSSIHT
ncbi:uncharacterized protein EV420DRAFT_1497541 [Desarmillaria tabescens]|uniref:Uncharacterized protein n=1 Tax=Armillaria tabescens TaxID=1929756 RepID=A0AA39NQF7_ARMTA|nr:uncharacterized protein EV420DRAFT_1497541 [Desarmillaria tabescens]KAK0469923.1 hypothetical protein EV420DRAFT_1497541 [Desarmillaria tabescens]